MYITIHSNSDQLVSSGHEDRRNTLTMRSNYNITPTDGSHKIPKCQCMFTNKHYTMQTPSNKSLYPQTNVYNRFNCHTNLNQEKFSRNSIINQNYKYLVLYSIFISICFNASLCTSENSSGTRPIRADVFSPDDNYNVTVTNTCDRQSMRVDVRTTKPFFGVIHTRDQRRKPICTIEGNGDTQYTLEINHVLAAQDALYCGVTRFKESREAKEQLNVVVVVRVHRNIELSDDRFFLLTCPNRCSRPDCSRSPSRSGDLIQNNPNDPKQNNSGSRNKSDKLTNSDNTTTNRNDTINGNDPLNGECTIWKFPWLITLCWCLAIIALSLLIVNCFLCSTLSCRFTKSEVEERAPSVYEDEDGIVYEPYKIAYDSPTAAKLGAHHQVPLERRHDDNRSISSNERDNSWNRHRHHQNKQTDVKLSSSGHHRHHNRRSNSDDGSPPPSRHRHH